jgi:hypothetical protein
MARVHFQLLLYYFVVAVLDQKLKIIKKIAKQEGVKKLQAN